MLGRRKSPLVSAVTEPDLQALAAKIAASYRELDARIDALLARLTARLPPPKER
jgi:hypothetical protein